MTSIAIVTSSVRPNRVGLDVANWVKSVANQRGDAAYEVVDIADFNLPLWDGAPGAEAPNEEGRAFTAKMAEFDGYVFVVAEYNHSITGAFKNALDYLQPELHNKAAGFVSYGSAMGARAVEHLRNILSEAQVAHVRNAALLSLFTDFENFSVVKPSEPAAASVPPMLDQLIVWTKAMEAVRAGQFAPVGAAV
ncbi:NADPH-dependent FMN reductase [Brevibacterium daeguense]|uniref:NADPH-dependent FMN reductase n=1 Tax=Brevibacterium daeguense TaxID=909936 RepID=A0ABP8EH30_9MICO|nr:NAD(P)H-dependent oxidoreductase [Brevibacterium daeguense]